ncbi:Phosphoribosylaminoimidazole-succinocarboxamide synthase [subsurface metagenome]
MPVILETNLSFSLFKRGKVRDVYNLGDKLLIVSTDRISAFDYVLPCGVPEKGRILNQLSAFWFKKTAHIIPNHFIQTIDNLDALQDVIATASTIIPNTPTGIPTTPTVIARNEQAPQSQRKSDSSLTPGTSLVGRSMLVAKAHRIAMECIVRGYLSGSAWAEYKQSGGVGNIRLPSGIEENQELPQPIFTPTTKSDVEHDRPLTREDVTELGIEHLMAEMERTSLLIYRFAQDYAKTRGIMIGDTKFEFGLINGKLSLIDELLTPDSSRFWDASQYEVGQFQHSLDKQPVRDWLLASGWDKESPPPMLPPEIIQATTERYNKIYSLFTKE